MPVFEVTVRQEATYYVIADTEKQAQDDADELSTDLGHGGGPDWDELEIDVWESSSPTPNAWYWSGGENGQYTYGPPEA